MSVTPRPDRRSALSPQLKFTLSLTVGTTGVITGARWQRVDDADTSKLNPVAASSLSIGIPASGTLLSA